MSLNPFESSLGDGINAVGDPKDMVWVKIPVAVDSGACAHVAPKDVFSLMCEESAGSKAREKWFGAEGTAILNLGKQIHSTAGHSPPVLLYECRGLCALQFVPNDQNPATNIAM